jgi:hypothetical protein
MSWLENAKKRAEKLGDIPDSLGVLAPDDGVEFLKASRRITNEDAPLAYALLERAEGLIIYLRAVSEYKAGECGAWLRALKHKDRAHDDEDRTGR